MVATSPGKHKRGRAPIVIRIRRCQPRPAHMHIPAPAEAARQSDPTPSGSSHRLPDIDTLRGTRWMRVLARPLQCEARTQHTRYGDPDDQSGCAKDFSASSICDQLYLAANPSAFPDIFRVSYPLHATENYFIFIPQGRMSWQRPCRIILPGSYSPVDARRAA